MNFAAVFISVLNGFPLVTNLFITGLWWRSPGGVVRESGATPPLEAERLKLNAF